MTVPDYDAELRAYNQRLRSASGVQAGDQVLDIGCGAGQSTREAARAAAPGRVLGIDLSASMIERARELTAAERLDNVAYELGDAEVHPFAPAHYDLAISRFGTMFFSDPQAAFGNIAHALRPQGRLVALVWQARERNEWARAIDAALGDQASARAGDPFSLGDKATTADLLDRSGFDDVHFDALDKPVFYGDDVDCALAFIRDFRSTNQALANLDRGDAGRAVDRLHETLAAHHADGRGVVFDSRAWMITARRR